MLDCVLRLLEHMAANTAMYVHPVQVATVQSYLHGLETGCRLGGLDVTRDVYIRAAAARGWEFRSTGIIWHMRERGLHDEQVIAELLAVEAAAFRLAAGGPAEPPPHPPAAD